MCVNFLCGPGDSVMLSNILARRSRRTHTSLHSLVRYVLVFIHICFLTCVWRNVDAPQNYEMLFTSVSILQIRFVEFDSYLWANLFLNQIYFAGSVYCNKLYSSITCMRIVSGHSKPRGLQWFMNTTCVHTWPMYGQGL